MAENPERNIEKRWPDISEIRLISDLRVMHAKVAELYHMVLKLKQRHSEAVIEKYADAAVLAEDIQQVDEIYQWFVSLKEEHRRSGLRRA